jgi:Class III cytochrome C family/Outer membrane cytochrome MtrC/MtrF-like, domains II/IV
MAKRRPFGWGKVLIPAIVLAGVFFAIASVYSNTDRGDLRPDILMIDLPAIPGGDRMPAVQFLHDVHTEQIQEKKNCSTCHLEKDQKIVFTFMRLEMGTTETDMAIYHDNCIACHEKTAASGKMAGPVTGDCRSCHKTQPGTGSSRKRLSFDKSLHYRHESAVGIPPVDPGDNGNCSACHHTFDKTTQKTVYTKGEEGSCRYCHMEKETEAARSFRSASHDACVNCHQTLTVEKKTAGPTDCAGCHSAGAQKAIKTLASVPRMKRNQPDVTLLASWMTDQPGDAEKVAQQMDPVPFNHEIHEQANATCQSCHHQTLKKCADCHTETGNQDGGHVTLAQAMHASRSSQSCIGCHKAAQKDKDCAGCHAGMPDKPFAEENCNQCHRVDRSALGPWPMSKTARTNLAAQAFKTASTRTMTFTDDQVPEKVLIDILAEEYEGAQFPHRQIFRSIESRIADNGMAGHFHDQQATLCMGCHHNSPATLKPPKCAACHGEVSKGMPDDGRPGLMGAYHGQCISCHQAMGIREPAATDCGKCHKEKQSVKQ